MMQPLFAILDLFYTFLLLQSLLYSFRIFIAVNKDGRFKRGQGMWLLGIYLAYVVSQYVLNIGRVHG